MPWRIRTEPSSEVTMLDPTARPDLLRRARQAG